MNKKAVIKIVVVLVILIILFLWASFYFINKQKESTPQEGIEQPQEQTVTGKETIPEQETIEEDNHTVVVEIPIETASESDAGSGAGSGGSSGGSSEASESSEEEILDKCKYIKNSKDPECI